MRAKIAPAHGIPSKRSNYQLDAPEFHHRTGDN
jgi:hypothetical protein